MLNEYGSNLKSIFILIGTRQGTVKAWMDPDEVETVEKFDRWNIHRDRKGRPFARSGKESGQQLLHQVLYSVPKGSKLVWKNGDTLDCRRENLQLVDKDGNVTELQPPEPEPAKPSCLKCGEEMEFNHVCENNGSKKSDVKGVVFHKASQRWTSRPYWEGKRYSLGYYKTEQEAIDETLIFNLEGPTSPALKINMPKGDRKK